MIVPLKLNRPLFWIWMLYYSLSLGDSTHSNALDAGNHNMLSTCAPTDRTNIPPLCTKNYVCNTLAGQNLTIQCGDEKHTVDGEQSYTYTVFGSNIRDSKILANDSNSLVLTLEPDLNSQTVYCYPNSHIYNKAIACYELDVQYAPIEDQHITWPSGYSSVPMYKEPFGLTCPLHSNPSANYSWVRYGELDLNEMLELPNDFIYSDNRKQWRVDYYDPTLHNGVYICNAWNSLGNASYDGLNFFLNAQSCVYSNTGNNTLHIHPSDEVLYYPPKSTVTLNCTLSPAEYSRYTITWYIIVNDSYVKPSYHNEFISQTANYSEILCQWTNTLTIRNFSKELEGNYTCGFHRHWKNQTIALLREDTSNNKEATAAVSVAIVAAVVGSISVVTVFVVVLGYLKRRRQLSYEKYKEPPDNGYECDVFICAHDEVRNLVENSILKPLEEECNPPYTICWHHRDFIAGLNIAEQIGEYIHTKSRKIMFVFSEKFTDSTFCNMELSQALHRLLTTHTRCIIPITLSENAVPSQLRRMLTYWPVVHTNDDGFVQKLTELIGEPITVTKSDQEHLMHDAPNAHAEQHAYLL